MQYEGFIDLKFKPSKEHLIAEFFLEPNKVSFEEAASAIASESSIGTWTDICTEDKKRFDKLKARIFYLNKKQKIAKIAYPKELFELNNIPQVLSSVAGNVFGMNAINNLRLEDVNLPDSMIKSFKGPKFGIAGVRKLMKIPKRPFVGTIIKPKLGLNESQHAKVAFEAWVGGCDFVKDDENLTHQSFNHFEKRVQETLRLRDKAEKITGERKMYFPNITAETNEMLSRAKCIKALGGEYLMVDVITVGFSALQTLRDADLGLVLHGHRAMHAALTRNPHHGISMLTLAKFYRLIGLDQLHVGAIVGKMEGSAKEVEEIGEQIEHKIIQPHKELHALGEEWMHIKPMLAVCSGGLHPGKIPKLVKYMGKDIVIQAGGGVHGHPNGTIAGAKAMRQALDAVMQGKTLQECAKTHKELLEALKKWKS